jgi:hypothetical protein
MQLTLSDSEAEVLRDTVKQRLDTLVGSLGDTDAMSYKPVLRSEIDTLEAIYNQLGCAHETGTTKASCDYLKNEDSPREWMGNAD